MLAADSFAAIKARLTIPPFKWLITDGAQFLIIHKLHHRYSSEQVCNGRELNQAIRFGPAGAVYQFFGCAISDEHNQILAHPNPKIKSAEHVIKDNPLESSGLFSSRLFQLPQQIACQKAPIGRHIQALSPGRQFQHRHPNIDVMSALMDTSHMCLSQKTHQRIGATLVIGPKEPIGIARQPLLKALWRLK